MSVIIFPEPDGVPDGRILYFDVATNIREESALETTVHPVEDGADVTDHTRRLPSVLEFDAYVTNTPLYPDWLNGRGAFKSVELEIPEQPLGLSLNNAVNALAGAIGSLFNPPSNAAQLLTFDALFDQPREIFDALQDIQDNSIPCRVVTRMRTIPKAMVENATPTGGADTGTGRSFNIVCRAFRTAGVKTVTEPLPSAPRGSGSKSGGKSGGKEAGSKSAAQKKSLLYGYLNPE